MYPAIIVLVVITIGHHYALGNPISESDGKEKQGSIAQLSSLPAAPAPKGDYVKIFQPRMKVYDESAHLSPVKAEDEFLLHYPMVQPLRERIQDTFKRDKRQIRRPMFQSRYPTPTTPTTPNTKAPPEEEDEEHHQEQRPQADNNKGDSKAAGSGVNNKAGAGGPGAKPGRGKGAPAAAGANKGGDGGPASGGPGSGAGSDNGSSQPGTGASGDPGTADGGGAGAGPGGSEPPAGPEKPGGPATDKPEDDSTDPQTTMKPGDAKEDPDDQAAVEEVALWKECVKDKLCQRYFEGDAGDEACDANCEEFPAPYSNCKEGSTEDGCCAKGKCPETLGKDGPRPDIPDWKCDTMCAKLFPGPNPPARTCEAGCKLWFEQPKCKMGGPDCCTDKQCPGTATSLKFRPKLMTAERKTLAKDQGNSTMSSKTILGPKTSAGLRKVFQDMSWLNAQLELKDTQDMLDKYIRERHHLRNLRPLRPMNTGKYPAGKRLTVWEKRVLASIGRALRSRANRGRKMGRMQFRGQRPMA